jgi:hypothetical protein
MFASDTQCNGARAPCCSEWSATASVMDKRLAQSLKIFGLVHGT